MNQFRHNQLPPFMVGPHDRLTIEGKAFRLAYATNEAYVLAAADGGVAETFTFAHLRRLNAAGKIRHEIEVFLPEQMRSASAVDRRASRSRCCLRRTVNGCRSGTPWCALTRRCWPRERSSPTTIRSRRGMEDICKRATKYLAEEVDLERELREDEARKSKKVAPQGKSKEGKLRKLPGGKAGVAVEGVHPRTLRKWWSLYREGGKAALIDRVAGRGNRSSFYSADENALLMATVRSSYLHPNRPTVAITVQDVKDAFAVENEARGRRDCPLSAPRAAKLFASRSRSSTGSRPSWLAMA